MLFKLLFLAVVCLYCDSFRHLQRNHRIYTSFYLSKDSSSSRPTTEKEIIVDRLKNIVGSLATAFTVTVTTSKITNADEQGNSLISPQITDKVFLDIKIANYTEESVGTNKGALGSGRVVFGLYGKEAPESVQRFLDVINSDGFSTPSFDNAQFSRVTEEGLLLVE